MNELVPKTGDLLLCVKVGKVRRENMYEMTRKYWRANKENASRATHVLAIVNGIVEAVFVPQEWRYIPSEGRSEFIGYELKDSEYIGKSIAYLYKRGASNPVVYLY